jgi:hypothetical protein
LLGAGACGGEECGRRDEGDRLLFHGYFCCG